MQREALRPTLAHKATAMSRCASEVPSQPILLVRWAGTENWNDSRENHPTGGVLGIPCVFYICNIYIYNSYYSDCFMKPLGEFNHIPLPLAASHLSGRQEGQMRPAACQRDLCLALLTGGRLNVGLTALTPEGPNPSFPNARQWDLLNISTSTTLKLQKISINQLPHHAAWH